MGTVSMISSIQPRSGPYRQPPNRIFRFSDNGDEELCPSSLCRCLAVIFCASMIIVLVKFYMDSRKIHVLILLLIIPSLIVVGSVVGIVLVCCSTKKQDLVVCIQPSVIDQESQNMAFPQTVASHNEMARNPPTYDFAVAMPNIPRNRSESLPPPYNTIIMM